MNIRNSIIVILLLSSLGVIAADTTQCQGLLRHLKKYREMNLKVAWAIIHYARPLKIGDVDKNIPAIKRRLILLGDINDMNVANDTFDVFYRKDI